MTRDNRGTIAPQDAGARALAISKKSRNKINMDQSPSQSFSPDARFMLGISQLGLSVAAEISSSIAHVHREIHGSTPLGRLPSRLSLSQLVYGIVQGSFLLPARLAGMAGGRFVESETNQATLSVQAAINGVFGDLLARQTNPLAFPMSLQGDSPMANKPLLVFIHGLCLHDQTWHSPAHKHFVDDLQKRGVRVAIARYNSGLAIADNGLQLASLLETTGASQLILVGHSMGGLIARSALHQAQLAGHCWPDRVTHLATLGSPHHGAEAERIGNYANRLLTITPWSAPLTRLGNLRSAAIQDLRFGSLLPTDRARVKDPLHTEDPREPVPAPESVSHLFVAATRSEQQSAGRLRGDMLVRPESALAEHYPGTASVRRELLYELDHLQLMWNDRVYQLLESWLEKH